MVRGLVSQVPGFRVIVSNVSIPRPKEGWDDEVPCPMYRSCSRRLHEIPDRRCVTSTKSWMRGVAVIIWIDSRAGCGRRACEMCGGTIQYISVLDILL